MQPLASAFRLREFNGRSACHKFKTSTKELLAQSPIAPNLKPDLTDQTSNPKPTLYIQPEKVKLNRVNVHCESQGAFSPGSAASNSPCLLKLTSGICFRNARCGFGVVGSCPRAKTWCSEHTSSDITSYTFQDSRLKPQHRNL